MLLRVGVRYASAARPSACFASAARPSMRVASVARPGATAGALVFAVRPPLFVIAARPLVTGSSLLKQVPVALTTLDYVGTVAFAASGTMVAGQAGMDVLGCAFVGTVTSLGGGTIRDLLLGRTPVFWFKDTSYLLLCLGTALATFFARDSLDGMGLLDEELLWWGDTLGIGAFSVVGAQAALSCGVHPVVTALCGMFTATCGGLVRDVLCRRQPRLLYSPKADAPAAAGTLYAPAALSGATLFTALSRVGAGAPLAIAAGGACTVAVRLWGSVYNVKLPTYAPRLADEAPAPRLDPVDCHLFVTAYAPDRIGHVAALTKCLADARANISASKILTIGDDLAFMMVVSAPHAARGDLAERVKAAGRDRGMVVQTHDITPSQAAGALGATPAAPGGGAAAPHPKHTAKVELTGRDSPGLVHHLTSVLRDHGLNIAALDSRVYSTGKTKRRDTPEETARGLSQRASTDVFHLAAVVTAEARPKRALLDADVARLKQTFHLDVLDVVFEEEDAAAPPPPEAPSAKKARGLFAAR